MTASPVATQGGEIALSTHPDRRTGWRYLPWALLALFLVTSPWTARIWTPGASRTRRQPVRLSVDLASSSALLGELGSAAVLSPDGRRVAYVADPGDGRRLFIRRLDQLESNSLAGTEGAYAPFFAPDGQWVGFFAAGKLRKVEFSGGSPFNVSDIEAGEQARGGAWGRGGNIVYTPQFEGGLYRIPDSGGKAEPLTHPDAARKERSHRWPCFLPDGKNVLFAVQSAGKRYDEGEIDVVSLETGKRKKLYDGGAFPRYSSSGHLLFVRNDSLFAVPLDVQRMEIAGSPKSVVDSLSATAGDQETGDGSAQYDVSESGSLLYRSGALGQSALTMVWVDRKGIVTPLIAEKHAYNTPAISPDGKKIAVGMETPIGAHIWVYEIDRGILTRLTFEGTGNSEPVWTPDGKRIVYTSLGDGGVPNLFWKRADGAGEAERLMESSRPQYAHSWSPDGKTLFYFENFPDTRWDIMMMHAGAKSPVETFLKTPAIEGFAAFSPDGRWVAYESDESGRFEIYVRPFQGPGGKWQLSTQGGISPRWSPAGKELFYRNGDSVLSVSYRATEDSFVAERPRELFHGPFAQFQFAPGYDVTPDGQRFVMFTPEGDEARMARTHVVLVLDWSDELRTEFNAENGKGHRE